MQHDDTSVASVHNNHPNEEPTLPKQPITPERPPRSRHRTSSSSSSNKIEDYSPKTPPSSRKLAQLISQSPTAHNNDNSLPPGTPFNYSSKHNKLSNVPVTPHSTEQRGFRPELIDDLSPLKSPSNFNQRDDDEKPAIRQISSTLKTRLSYAMVKLQNGWSNQSLDELEKNMNQDEMNTFKPTSHNIKGSLTSPPSKSSKLSTSKISKIHISPNRRVETPNYNKDHDGSINDDGSANTAFLRAISKSRSPKRKINHKNVAPLKLIHPPLNPENNPEADAIETLMSLASPKPFKTTIVSPSHSALPRQRLKFGEELHVTNENKDDQGDETDVEDETDIEVSNDEKMEQGSAIDEDAAKTEDEADDEDVRTASEPESP